MGEASRFIPRLLRASPVIDTASRASRLGVADRASRLVLVLLLGHTRAEEAQQATFGAGWSIRGAGIDIGLDDEAVGRERAAEGWCAFSLPLGPGAYALRYAGAPGAAAREIAAHLSPGWTTQIAIDHDALHPHFETARIFLTRGQGLPPRDVVRQVQEGLSWLQFGGNDQSDRWARGIQNSFLRRIDQDPMLGLLAAHLLASSRTPDPTRIAAMAAWLESLLGPCPDVQALRLRAARLRGVELPRQPCAAPPMLREGLHAFVEASHSIPALIVPGSTLEFACVERLVDSPFSSWPVRHEQSGEENWLSTALRDLAEERPGGKATLDARAIARELGVPTPTVQGWLEDGRMVRLPEGMAEGPTDNAGSLEPPNEEAPPASEPPPASWSEIAGEVLERHFRGDYQGAFTLATRFLAVHPDHGMALRCAENSRLMLEQEPLARIGDMSRTPRLLSTPEELRHRELGASTARIVNMIDGRSTVNDLVAFSYLPALDVLRILAELREEGTIEIVGPGW